MIAKFVLYVEVRDGVWIDSLGIINNPTWIPLVNTVIEFGNTKYMVIGHHCLFPDTIDVLCECMSYES